ncbi:MAG TPA: FAD-dependent oxidoreductase [Gemmataceae bacterium]
MSAEPIVILGGGFAGVYAARHLERHLHAGHDIILFSQENHLVFTPLLGNVVGSSINPMHVVWPVRQMLRRATCRTAAVVAVDLPAREVHYRTPANQLARQPFGHLVLACGNVVKLDIIPGMAAHGWPLKTMGDALVLRNHLIGLLEKAQVEPDPDRRRQLLSVVVVGGGFSGVEVAGEIADLLKESARFYSDVPIGDVRVTLLHRGDRILPELPPTLGEFARLKMQARGIDIRLKSEAAAVTEWGVRLKAGDEVPAATVVCTIGTTANPLLTAAGLPMEKGRVKAGSDFRVQGFENVWALGDCAAVPNAHDGQLCPPTAQFATRQARALARNLAAATAGKPAEPFRFKPLGAFASIGNRRAVGQVFGLRFSGLPAWFLWRGIYLSKMPTLARKVQIAFDWGWQIFFPRDIVQLNLWQTERLNHAHYETGQYVFHRGDPGDKFYLIEHGKAGVYLADAGPPVAVLGEGDHFGEGALLSGSPRSAHVRAEEPLDVLVLSQQSFAQLTHHCRVLRTVVERVWRQRERHDRQITGGPPAAAGVAANAPGR